METVVSVMMILVCFNYLLKQTCRKPGFVLLSAVAAALFVGAMWPWAIEQSKTQIGDWLADSALMHDTAVVLTLEVAVQMSFCILAARIRTSGKVRTRTLRLYRLLRWFPGVLIYPVLFSVLVAAIFALPGVPFSRVAWSLAALLLVAVPFGAWALKQLLPEKEIRLELLFLSNALIAVLGIVATVNGRTAAAGVSQVDWAALTGIALLIVAGLGGGIAAYRRKLRGIIKKQIKS